MYKISKVLWRPFKQKWNFQKKKKKIILDNSKQLHIYRFETLTFIPFIYFQLVTKNFPWISPRNRIRSKVYIILYIDSEVLSTFIKKRKKNKRGKELSVY